MSQNFEIVQANAHDLLAHCRPGTVQTCITSPPYWGLRDYGVEGQIGLEKDLKTFISELVLVFRQVQKALRRDGTLWLNLGDTYSANHQGPTRQGDLQQNNEGSLSSKVRGRKPPPGTRLKSLLGVPWRVAFALEKDGWILRSDIIWHKPNPMPESVKDRPTKAHEYLFLLAKERKYLYDDVAIREQGRDQSGGRVVVPAGWAVGPGSHSVLEHQTAKNHPSSKAGRKWDKADRQAAGRRMHENTEAARKLGGDHDNPFSSSRNKRTVWTIAAEPFPGSHFAVMPTGLVKPCIMAGSRPGDLVLDPFAGSGTVGAVAVALGRDFLGVELNPEYCEMARLRVGEAARQGLLL